MGSDRVVRGSCCDDGGDGGSGDVSGGDGGK